MGGKLSEAQRRALAFLQSDWTAAWWGGRPLSGYPKGLNARAFEKLNALKLVTCRRSGRFSLTYGLTPTGRQALAHPLQQAPMKEVGVETFSQGEKP